MLTHSDQKQNDQASSGKEAAGGVFGQKEQAATKSNAIEVPSIALPKGGGALKGIDETFQVNAANGTASFSVPLPFSPNARNGFTPQLALSYNSGTGNGLFGLGWDLSLPAIQRRTDKKLPRYRDTNEESQIGQEDSFMFSGVEELVPYLELTIGEQPAWKVKQSAEGDFIVRQYRPRIEGGFSRIERIFHSDHGYYWRVTSKENITTFFGFSVDCRIADPTNPDHVFQWLPEFSYDDKGSWIWYGYKAEDLTEVENQLHEKNRINRNQPFANRHIKRIKYGNAVPAYFNGLVPYRNHANFLNTNPHFFELVFDYGDHDAAAPTPTDAGNWKSRADAFSVHRAGFEMRSYRLCQRVLMFHEIPGLNDGKPTLVRAISFDYKYANLQQPETPQPPVLGQDSAEVTYLMAIEQIGYVKNQDTYTQKSLPKMTFDYQWLSWNTEVREVSQDSLVHAPTGLAGNYQWVDLYNEGISGILSEQANGWYYKHNLGDAERTGDLHFAPAKEVMPKPSFMGLSNGVLQLQDLNADGQKQLVVTTDGVQGYFELSDDDEWQPFVAFAQRLNLNLRDPNVRLFDLNGDGKPDVVLTDQGAFTIWENLGKVGYDSPEVAAIPFDEEKGPAIVFSDVEQRIFLADMSGDGLTDIVRIRNGEVCYWPNQGYGKFGAKVTMSNAPWFDDTDLFNPQYLQLTDISGTGATDLIYLGKNQFNAYLNLSGNAWSKPTAITPFFPTELPNRVTVTDLLGNGTACIVWSSEQPAYSQAPMRYMDLMGGIKPHIMKSHENGMGKRTEVEFKSSTYFYLQDKLNGTPWLTKLPFPVQVVSKNIVTDSVTNARFTAQYTYHHGFYDHTEREFRGFGRVEQIDTETYSEIQQAGSSNGTTGEGFHEPPVLTKTWFHTGSVGSGQTSFLKQYEPEYWYNLSQTPEFKDDVLADAYVDFSGPVNDLTATEWREAARACKGMALRQEVFALDGSAKERTPYSVATHACFIRPLQPQETQHYAVFIVLESEGLSFSYERNASDPRIAHSLNLAIDEFGNVLNGVSVVYGRVPAKVVEAVGRLDHSLHVDSGFITEAQTQTHLIYTETNVTTDAQEQDGNTPLAYYRLPLPWSVNTYEVDGIEKSGSYYKRSDFQGLVAGTNVVVKRYDEDLDLAAGQPQLRLIEQVETLLLSYDLVNPLPAGQHGALGLPFESYQLAYTPQLIDHLFNTNPNGQPRVSDAELTRARYLQRDNNWWIRSGTVHYFDGAETRNKAQDRFYLPIVFKDPFGSTTNIAYDDTLSFIKKATDAHGNETTVEQFDYRVLAPRRLKDVNNNLSEVSFDALGLVVGVAVMGKGTQADNLEGFIPDLSLADIASFFADPFLHGPELLQNATSRMVYDYSSSPVKVGSIMRETHVSEERGTPSKLQYSFEYTDGLGKSVLKKVRAEAGKAKKVENGVVVEVDADPRWVGNGRTILNNKGKPIKQYEPYFSITHLYEDEPALQLLGVTPVLHYDSAGRLIRTKFPDGTFTKVEYDSWQQTSYDQNDTVLESSWKTIREHPDAAFLAKLAVYGGDLAKERTALAKALVHANTPTTVLTDSLGRPFYTIAHNRWQVSQDGQQPQVFTEFLATRAVLDIEGNLRQIFDARGNIVMAYDQDMLGHTAHQRSMDAGERWLLNDCMGKPTWAWDSKNQRFETRYDQLHRPLQLSVTANERTTVLDKTDYGDSANLSAADRLAQQNRNFIGQTIRHFDGAGMMEVEVIDFKGNVLRSVRQFTTDAKQTPTWTDDLTANQRLLRLEKHQTTGQFDALNRPVLTTAADGSKTRPVYNEANLLNDVWVTLPTTPDTPTTAEKAYVKNIDYDEKGRRTRIDYGNQTRTTYQYDPDTFRLMRLTTTKASSTEPNRLQDLLYTYDPVGNITQIEDKAQQTLFFDNAEVAPQGLYAYDALYRLIWAQGREHVGQNNSQTDIWSDAPRMGHTLKENWTAMRTYTQRYDYDAVGNMLTLKHTADNGSFTRTFTNRATNNQLLTTSDSATAITYDAHGNMLNMPHLSAMDWNEKDQLAHITQGTTNAWYVYDSSGQRVRKLVEKQDGPTEERLYLGPVEIYREYRTAQPETITKERQTLHILDDTGRIAMVETLTKALTANDEARQLTRYQYGNHLGSASLELNDAARIISYEEYHPYGTTAYQARNADIKAAAKRYRYTGMERDEETGLAYHTARYYAPWLCRWTAADPIGIEGGINLYEYCGGNSIGFNDLLGKESEPFILLDENSLTSRPASALDVKGSKPVQDITTDSNSKDDDQHKGKEWISHPSGPLGFTASVLVGGRGSNASRRYSTLTPNQTFARGLMDKGWGCTLCHITTQVWNNWGPRGVNPENNLPYDYYINMSEFRDFVVQTTLARASLELFLTVGSARASFRFSPTVSGTINGRTMSNPTIPDEPSVVSSLSLIDSESSSVSDIITLDKNGLPKQLGGEPVGPAFSTLEKAAKNGNHTMEVVVSENGKVIGNWWEASEKGLNFAGHTEQKALTRINLRKGISVEFRGTYPPCPYSGGCMNTLQYMANKTGAEITYRYNNTVIPFQKE